MGIEIVDLVDMAHKEKRRKNIFNTARFHAWMHYYKPGQKDAMHCITPTKPSSFWTANAR